MFRFLKITCGVALLLLIAAFPLLAQTQNATPDPNDQVVLVGTVDLSQGVIMVNGYIVVPSPDFQSATLYQGDLVVVIGYIQPDGVTVQATSVELFDEYTPPPEATEEPTAEVTPEITPEPTSVATAEVTPEPVGSVGCSQTNQPVAQRLADLFGVSYNEIMGWHCAGFGFGEIARAYLLADATGDTPQSYFADRQAGEGWGQIVKDAGVHPSELAPGHVIRPGHDQNDDGNGTSDDHPGNGNGHGNGNNGGNGNGNGNGGGNGNGKGGNG